MICKNCGAIMPDEAHFCGECGMSVLDAQQVHEKVQKEDSRLIGRYKITVVIQSIALIIMAIALIAVLANGGSDKTKDDSPKKVSTITNGVELSGKYIVGEDEELTPGRYNIGMIKGEEYFDVIVFADEEAWKKYKDDYDSSGEAVDYIYSEVHGYKLKAGNVVVIRDKGAVFEKVDAADATDEEDTNDE